MQHAMVSGFPAVLLYAVVIYPASSAKLNPLEKTVALLTKLQGTVVSDGEREEQAYKEYYQWCKATTSEKQFEVKTATKEKAKLEADIQLATSDIEASTAKIDELSTLLSSNAQKLKEITAIRSEESGVFKSTEAELMKSIDMLGRAIETIERELQSGSSSLLQGAADTGNFQNVLLGLGAVIDAGGLPAKDGQQLTALLQSRQDAAETEVGEAGLAGSGPGGSSSIVELMEDMREKAELQLHQSRQAEANAKNNYQLLKQSLEEQTRNADKDMKDEKADKAAAEESKATAQGDLFVTVKELAKSQEALKNTQDSCLRTAADHEMTVQGRKVELEVLAKAKKTIQSSMLPAAASFMQVASSSSMRVRSRTRFAPVTKQVIGMVRQLAAKHKSAALAQLASRLLVLVRHGMHGGGDPFVKVRGLILDMIKKLEAEASSEAREKEYCDHEMKKTKAERGELQDGIEGLKGKIDQAASTSASLKGQVKELQTELADLARQQAEMDEARKSSHATYAASKRDLQQGLDGIRAAIRLLRDYYASGDKDGGESLLQSEVSLSSEMAQPDPPQRFERSSGAGSAIIGLLEVAESDLAKQLAEEETEEAGKVLEYEKLTQENKVLKTLKEKDVQYKTREHKALDKGIADLSADFDTTSEQLDAVSEYFAKVKERCVAKPESYEERKQHRAAEIRGLREALEILQDSAAETNLLQRGRRPH